MVPSVCGGGVGGGVPGPESPPSTSAEGVKGPLGLLRCDLHLQCCLRTQMPQMEPSSGA